MFLVGTHFVLITLIIGSPGISIKKSFEIIAVIAPLLAGFSTVIIKYFVSESKREAKDRSLASGPLVFFAFLIPSCLLIAIVYLVAGYAFALLEIDFETLKLSVGGLEVFFGVYVGFIVHGLYERKEG